MLIQDIEPCVNTGEAAWQLGSQDFDALTTFRLGNIGICLLTSSRQPDLLL
jgi:hypothetical protein